MADLIIRSDLGDGITEAIFDDDGSVAYCYIVEHGIIKSDVWIYNRKKAPNNYPWKDGSQPPYLNPKDYALEILNLPKEKSDISIEWQKIKGEKPTAIIKVFGEILGSVSADTKPGYARLARKEGPLARLLR